MSPGFAVTGARLAGASSVLARDVRGAPLHPHSEHVVAHLLAQVALATPNLNATQYGVSVYEVGPDVPLVDVAWRGHAQAGDALYAGLLGLDPKRGGYPWPIPTYDVLPPSVGAFRGVPLPAGARAAVGSDGELTVVQTRADGRRSMWEFWQARQDNTGAWSAMWGGYVDDLDASDGRYPGTLGVSASGLHTAPAAVRIGEARAALTGGVIDHAIGLAIPHVIGGRWSYPATRCDALPATSTAPFALHEGQRFRLPADLDVAALRTTADWRGRSYLVHPVCAAIVRAVQVRGFVVVDQTGSSVAIPAEEASASLHAAGLAPGVQSRPGPGAPMNPWTELLGGKATWQVLDGFPWDRLQALPHDWGKP